MGRELTRRVLGIPFLRDREMEAETRRALEAGGTRIPSPRAPRVEHLSGGQRQAIELNRFVHWGGKLVILDEPFAALGVEQTRRGLETIDRVRSRGIGVMLITHVMAQAFAVADRIVVLRHGVVAGDLPHRSHQPRRGRPPHHRRHRAHRPGRQPTREHQHEPTLAPRRRRAPRAVTRSRRPAPSPSPRARSTTSSRRCSTSSRPARSTPSPSSWATSATRSSRSTRRTAATCSSTRSTTC